MAKILLLCEIDPGAHQVLSERHHVVSVVPPVRSDVLSELTDTEAVVLRSGVEIDIEALDSASKLALIVRAGAGLDNIDVAEVERRGLRFSHVPHAGTRSVAEHTFALILSAMRRVPEGDRGCREGMWRKYELIGNTLEGKTIGIVGAGRIGALVGRLARAWDMEALGTVADGDDEARQHAVVSGVEIVTLDELLVRSHVVTLHVPLSEHTRGLVDDGFLRRMRPDALLVNIARGGVVDEAALLDALGDPDQGPRAAALDVHAYEGPGFASPFAALDNVVLTPHLGSMTREAQSTIGRRIVELVDEVFAMDGSLQ